MSRDHARPLQCYRAFSDEQLEPVRQAVRPAEGHWPRFLHHQTPDLSPATATDKRLVRRISYTTPLKKNSLGPSTADCVEEWRLQSWTADAFVVCVEARTPKV